MSLSIAELATCLNKESIEKRIEAAQQLSRLGTDASPAALSLLVACNSEDESLREWSTAALENCGAPQSQDLAQLIKYIESDAGVSDHTIYWALTLIGRLESSANSACTQVCHLVDQTSQELARDENNRRVRTTMLRGIWTLGKIAGGNSRAELLLKSLLEKFPGLEAQIQRTLDLLER